MRAPRYLVPVLLGVLALQTACASVNGEHLALVAARTGLERWESARENADTPPDSPLLADNAGRRNLAETNLNWAAALVESDLRPDLAGRVIDAVLAHQDTGAESSTRGLFRWYADPAEPHTVDATIYLAPALAYLVGETEAGRAEMVRARAQLALDGLLNSDKPEDGFGAAMWAGAVASLAQAVGEPEKKQAAASAVDTLLRRLREKGFGTVHSPTFDALRIGGLRWVWQHADSDEARAQARTALELCYADLLQRYAPSTGIVAGAIGRAYPAEYLGQTGVAQYLLSCDLTSTLALVRSPDPLVMYFALSEYRLPDGLLEHATERESPVELRTRTPAPGTEAIEATSTCTWVGDGLSLGTMSGIVTASCVPLLATCDLPDRPTSYVYPFGGPASVSSVQSGGLALCSFNFDGVGMGPRVSVGVSCVLGTRAQIKRVLIGSHEWIGEPEAVSQRVVVAVKRGNSYLGLKILDAGPTEGTRVPVKPAGIEWFAEGNMDSLHLKVYGRRADYPLDEPMHDVKVGLLVEVAPASQFEGLEQFAEHVGKRRVEQSSSEKTVRADEDIERQVPGRDELKSLAEMRFVKYIYHTLGLKSQALPLGLTEELLRNHVTSRTLPTALPADYLWASRGLVLQRGGEPMIGAEAAKAMAAAEEAAAQAERAADAETGTEAEDGAGEGQTDTPEEDRAAEDGEG